MKGRGASGDPEVAGVVLAAGRSRRMPGRSKLLRVCAGERVLHRVVRTALEAGLRPVVVVTGHGETEIRDSLCGLEVRFAAAPVDGGHPLRSLAAGIRGLGRDAAAAMVCLGDEPGLGPEPIETVRRAWRESRCELLRARFRDRPGHPVLIARSLFPRVEELARRAADHGAADSTWHGLVAAGAISREVPIDRLAPVDVDAPADLRRVRERLRTGGGRTE